MDQDVSCERHSNDYSFVDRLLVHLVQNSRRRRNNYCHRQTVRNKQCVTIIIVSSCIGIDPTTALEAAYEKIKNRTGKTVNGIFVKDTTQ